MKAFSNETPPAMAVRVLAQSAVPVSVTGTVNETTLASFTLKGGTMGNNGAIRVTVLWSTTNSSNNKIGKIKLGSLATGSTFTTSASATDQRLFRNRNAQNVQVYQSTQSFNLSPTAVSTGALDTSQDQTIAITGQLANSGEMLTMEAYTIELLPGAN